MYFIENLAGEVFNFRHEIDHYDEEANYNCGGYAFGIHEWFMPFASPTFVDMIVNHLNWCEDYIEDDDISEGAVLTRFANNYWATNQPKIVTGFKALFKSFFHKDCEVEDDLSLREWDTENCLDFCTYVMLNGFKWLRHIESWDELNDDEYGIVFAIGHGDFHFVRYEDGVYTHKMGVREIEEVESYEDAFGERYYIGPVFFAAKKEEFR